MSRGLSGAMQTALGAESVTWGMFLQFEFRDATYRFWTGETSISWDGHTWTGGALLGTIELSGEMESIESRKAMMTLNAVDQSFYLTAADPGTYRGRAATIWFAILNSAGDTVLYSHQTEKLRMSDLVMMDTGDSMTIRLSCESYYAELFRQNSVYLLPVDHKRYNPTDTFYDFVTAMLGKSLPWGLSAGLAAAKPVGPRGRIG